MRDEASAQVSLTHLPHVHRILFLPSRVGRRMFTQRIRRGVAAAPGVIKHTWRPSIGCRHVPHPLIGRNKSHHVLFFSPPGPTVPIDRSPPSPLPFPLYEPSIHSAHQLFILPQPFPQSRTLRPEAFLVSLWKFLDRARDREGSMGGRELLLLLISVLLVQIRASDPLFYEPFDESFEGRWVVPGKDDYKGVWKHAKSDGHEDYGLLVSEKANKYAIIKELDQPVTLKDGTVVLQFEVRLQNGLECGGAYLKYIRPQDATWDAKEFDNETPYTIMFGPDKCGSTNKVHFILKHKNPKSGKYVEHHLKFPPSVPYDKLSHVYTAILKPDNEVRILVDGEEKKKATFLSADDFEPALIPSKTIPDPDDKKPEDWDERAKIPDPVAVKPDDWDEDAPMEVEDEEATKPEGWLDDEPEEIDDPEATKPEDWDDEEDGEWEAPKIDNPKCEEAPGCGEWKKPMKQNPAYKGKWHAPLIDNPNYKGIWKPEEIPNPEYFELDNPDFDPIAAIGIEIWTMQDGILFDNILIADDEKVATSILEKTWKPKYEVEKEKEKDEEVAAGADGLSEFQKKIFDILYKIADIPFLEPYKTKIIDIIEKGEKQPNLTIGILVSIVVVVVTVLFRILFGGKKPAEAPVKPAAEATKPKVTETDAVGSSGDKEEDEKEDETEETAAPRRRSRRET